MYTLFYDMHSGGSQKLGASNIFIEAPEDEAIDLFERIFDRSPHNITCMCCGSDYEVYNIKKEPQEGDWVITKEDIDKLNNSEGLAYLREKLGDF